MHHLSPGEAVSASLASDWPFGRRCAQAGETPTWAPCLVARKEAVLLQRNGKGREGYVGKGKAGQESLQEHLLSKQAEGGNGSMHSTLRMSCPMWRTGASLGDLSSNATQLTWENLGWPQPLSLNLAHWSCCWSYGGGNGPDVSSSGGKEEFKKTQKRQITKAT